MSGKVVRDTVGFLGVVASLVFVGLEIRQNTAVARGQARQDLAFHFQDWLELRASSEELDDLFWGAWAEDAELTPGQERRAVLMMRIFLTRLENVFLQVDEGLVDETALNSYGWAAGQYFRSDRFRDYWERQFSGTFDPDFVMFFSQRFGLSR